ncbi:MAG: hypothetical protein AAF441_21170 [Pseudomonadota bacterium]
MHRLLLISALLATAAVAACKPAIVKSDPTRVEFVEACEGRTEYRSMKPSKRTAYCECGYDQTMSALSDEEKQVARFYLLSQVGVDVRTRGLISEPNFNGMMKASKAIGDAAKRCR